MLECRASTKLTPPTCPILFHLGLLHTILDERLDILRIMSKEMKADSSKKFATINNSTGYIADNWKVTRVTSPTG